ncbi:MAG: Ppx/GppA phosphatase family protein [Candidatus Flexifilum sp.]
MIETAVGLSARHDDRTPRRMAIIDMGSNSWRLIVVESIPGLWFKVVDEVRESVRISEGMAEIDVLRPAAMDRGVRAAQVYAAFCRAQGITDIVCAGTSAIRDARNQRRFIERLERETGLRVRVLSGEEEAYYGYLAAVNSTTLTDGFVIDLGGGSFQITRVENRRSVQTVSFPLGAVRVTERFLTSDPVTGREQAALSAHLRTTFATIPWFRREPGQRLIGEGGGLRLIGRLLQKRAQYPLDILHGYEMTLAQVASVRDELARLPIAARRRLPGMKADRADISLGGAIVVHEAMRAAGFDHLEICSQGLREGLFYAHYLTGDPPWFDDVRRAAVINLCHLYRFQEAHTHQIVHLTLSMFDQIPPQRMLCGPAERDLLWAACMLHDIGMAIDYHDHHKHGAYLLLNSGLPGYTHREIALIALLIRYHRKGQPSADELAPLLLDGDEGRLLQMCALLRLAEQLDRSRDGAVRRLILRPLGDRIVMEAHVSGEEAVPLWAVEQHREIFEAAFGVTLEIVSVPDEEEVAAP